MKKSVYIAGIVSLMILIGCGDDTASIDAVNDSARVAVGEDVTINVLANDISAYGEESKSIKSVTNGKHGNAVIQNNKVVYTSKDTYIGRDTFSYILKVDSGYTIYEDKAVVSVDIYTRDNASNHAPRAEAHVDKSTISPSETVQLTGTDSDEDGDSDIVSREWAHGTDVLSNTNSATYTPQSTGIYTFTYTVKDASGATASDSVDVNVTEASNNHAPIANDLGIEINCEMGAVTQFSLVDSASDEDNDTLTYIKVSNPSYGSATIDNNGTGEFTIDDSNAENMCQEGQPNSFKYKVNDGTEDSNEANVTILFET